jgi:hypothetical protein
MITRLQMYMLCVYITNLPIKSAYYYKIFFRPLVVFLSL